jgi:peptidyl-prolyl cis-trans isomerase D
MIEWMQKNRNFLVPTLWISAIAFIGSGAVGWGAYKYGGAGADSVATVGDRAITQSDLRVTTANLFNYYNNLFHGHFTKEMAKQMHLQQQALQKLVDDNLLLNYADELGITVLDDEIIKEYTSIDAFKVDGKFSKSRVEQILRSQGITKKEFENQIKKGIILKKLNTLLKMKATPLEEESIFAGKNLKNHIIIKKLPLDLAKVKIDEDELKRYWQAHKAEFKTPLSYTIEAIEIDASKTEVDETKLKPFYEENRLKFKDSNGKIKSFEDAKDEVKKLFQKKIAKKEALKSYLSLKKGKLKAQKSITVDASNAPFDFSKLKDLKSGSYIKALETKEGWLTGRVKSVNLPSPKRYEDAKEEAHNRLKHQKGIDELKKEAKAILKNGIKDGDDLGLLNASDTKKITKLSPAESQKLLQSAFSSSDKNGLFATGEGVIAYEIKDQKLLDQDALKKERALLGKNIEDLKSDSINSGLIRLLRKRYEIKQLVKFTNKKEG